MPLVQVTMLQGRTADQKRKLAQRITDVLVEEAGARREAVVVAFHEVSKESYAIRRGPDGRQSKVIGVSLAVRRGALPRDPPPWEVPFLRTGENAPQPGAPRVPRHPYTVRK
jgi:4-oxalocrotonate tautomerase family enzyme